MSLSTCYILDLDTGWTQAASLPTGLRNPCAVPLSGGAQVWVAGGYSSQSGTNVSQYQIYDVASNTWSATKAFPTTPAQICGPTNTGAWSVTNSRSITLYDTASDSVITTTHQFPFTTSLANSLICNSRLSDGSYCIPRTTNNLFGVRYAPSPESQIVYVYATKD
ncbi:hypothetical protein [Burkholderia lata]|uniref:hypothetical protein n=1 Tax=Burkholderia lata (strain ATCC 17760 / DSM 23089 / LMG 22485 / NCIMB 9086 / R18194 / 383) TaxID=482957 RepID=UPI0015843A7B|nr:hypothetical protein [Burkholderia lata]